MGKQWKQCQTLFFWAPKSLQMVTAAMKLKDAYSLDKDGPVRVLPALHTEAWPLTEPRMAEGSAPSSSAEADPES